MKQTLSLKKPLSFEQQAKITQKTGSVFDVCQQKESAEKEQLKKGIEWLVKTYPQCFDSKNPKPLKKRIKREILEEGLWPDSRMFLNRVLGFYVGSPFYHQALLKEKKRYDLEGNVVEKVSRIETEFANGKLRQLQIKRQFQNLKVVSLRKRNGQEPSL